MSGGIHYFDKLDNLQLRVLNFLIKWDTFLDKKDIL